MGKFIDVKIIRRFESLDTNVLLQLVAPSVPAQHKKVLELLAQPKTHYNVSDVAVAELVFALERKQGQTRAFVARALSEIMALETIECNREVIEEAVPEYLAHPKLSFADCFLAAQAAAERGEPLWTFDRDLAKQSGTAKLL